MADPRRVVVDPNVLVSAAISTTGGPPAALLAQIEAGDLVPIVSPVLLEELRRVRERKKFRRYLTLDAATAFVDKLARLGRPAEDPTNRPRVSSDPDDDYLVALARSATADALVCGDSDLLELHLPDLRVLTPRQLLDL